MKQAAMAAAAEFTWSNAALQYEAVFTELGVKDVLGGAGKVVNFVAQWRIQSVAGFGWVVA